MVFIGTITRKRRSKLDIIVDILLLLHKHGKQSKTMIMRRANLNLKRVNKYISFLLSKNFILLNEGSPQKIMITRRGIKFVEEYNKLKEAEEKFLQILNKIKRQLNLGEAEESLA